MEFFWHRWLAPVVCLTVHVATSSVARAQTPVKEAQAVKRAPKVIIIGLDGASLNLVEPLAAAGKIPNLAALLKEGVRADLASIWPMRTPQIWTTLVTGKYPGQHGIWDHYNDTQYSPPKFRAKRRRVLTTEDRRSKAIWNILDNSGMSVFSVGWISSWPAEKLEKSVMFAPVVLADASRQVSIKGTFWKNERNQVTPASLWPRVRGMIVEGEEITAQDLKAFAQLPEENSPLLKLPYVTRYVKALKWSLARAKTVEALTVGFVEEIQPDLLMAYFQCTDSLLHRFWIFQKSEEEIVDRLRTHGIDTSLAKSLKQHFGGVVEACYRDVDARVGRVLEKARGESTLVMVISDHGFGEAPVPHPTKTEPYGGNHRDMGILVAAAPWIDAGTRLEGITVLDIMPTLLRTFEQPLAQDMPGHVIDPLLAPQVRGKAASVIPSYEKVPQTEVPFKEGWPPRKQRPLAEDS